MTLSPVIPLTGDRRINTIFRSLGMSVSCSGERQCGETLGALSLTSQGLCNNTVSCFNDRTHQASVEREFA